jgi:hypothetical protein
MTQIGDPGATETTGWWPTDNRPSTRDRVRRNPTGSPVVKEGQIMSVRALLLLITLPMLAAGGSAEAQSVDPLQRVAFLLGRWEGVQEGRPGKGTASREYTRVLDGRLLRIVNRSDYPSQPANPKGESHRDEGFFSFDRARQRLVLRQFHVEGFVNQYVEDGGATRERISFTSEAIENIAPGWRARETYVVHGAAEFEEVFELAEPGKPFEVYSRVRFTRVRQDRR